MTPSRNRDQPIEPLPPTLSSMWRLCKLGYRHERRRCWELLSCRNWRHSRMHYWHCGLPCSVRLSFSTDRV